MAKKLRSEELKKGENTSSSTSSSSSSSSTTARAREDVLFESWGRVLDYAEEVLQTRAGRVMQQDVRDALLRDVDEAVLMACVDESAMAPRPSWGYARAILRRCITSGILTLADWEADKAAFGQRKAARPAGGFSQREYKREDFATGFFVEFEGDEGDEDDR